MPKRRKISLKDRFKMFGTFTNQIHTLREQVKTKCYLSSLLSKVSYFISLVNMGIKEITVSAKCTCFQTSSL